MEKSSTILVVGHDDVIEKSLVKGLREKGYLEVASSSDLAIDTAVQASVYNYFSKHNPEYVFLGSTRSGGIEANQKYAAEFIYHNIESQNNIVYAANKFGAKKLLYFAASCIYPKDAAQPMKEEALLTGPLEETSEAYSVAKIAGIHLCQAYRRQYNFNAIIAVPPTVYGPGSDTDFKNAHVMGALIGKIYNANERGEVEVTVWGSGKPKREFLYADDFVDVSIFLMDNYDETGIINIGSGSDITISGLADLIRNTVGFNGQIVQDESKPDGAMQKLLDNSKIAGLGWKAKIGLEEGIKLTVESFKNKTESNV